MKWNGHTWEAGPDAPDFSYPYELWPYYSIVSAHMPKSLPKHKVEAAFVEESTRDRIVKLWNATRHLEDNELKMLIAILEQTQLYATPHPKQ